MVNVTGNPQTRERAEIISLKQKPSEFVLKGNYILVKSMLELGLCTLDLLRYQWKSGTDSSCSTTPCIVDGSMSLANFRSA